VTDAYIYSSRNDQMQIQILTRLTTALYADQLSEPQALGMTILASILHQGELYPPTKSMSVATAEL
jgi:hypothetical protein